MHPDIHTTYLGVNFQNPFILASAPPLVSPGGRALSSSSQTPFHSGNASNDSCFLRRLFITWPVASQKSSP